MVRRLSGGASARRTATSTTWKAHFSNPHVCDQDGSRLIQRDDDKEETVVQPLEVYHEQTYPLVEYDDEKGLLRRFDGEPPQDDVNGHIRATLATLRLEAEL